MLKEIATVYQSSWIDLTHNISFLQVSGTLVCEAGCILENLISFLDDHG